MLRRRAPHTSDAELSVGGLALNPVSHEVTLNSTAISLGPTEFRLLHTLMRRPGQVFSRDRLIDGAIGEDAAVVDRTIDVHVTALRKKLGKAGAMTDAPFVSPIVNYYMTDPISRASRTMAECVASRQQLMAAE